jgi:hypothetical protein
MGFVGEMLLHLLGGLFSIQVMEGGWAHAASGGLSLTWAVVALKAGRGNRGNR